MKLSCLLPVLIERYCEKTGMYAAKTKLLKLAYLAEVEHVSRTGDRLLDEDWTYFHFGPFIYGYDDALKSPEIETGESSAGHEYLSIGLSEDYQTPELPLNVTTALVHVVANFATFDLNELLDYVYFDTEPMFAVEKRGDQLDMSTVKPAECYHVKERTIPPKKLSEFRKKHREKGRKLRSAT